MCILTDHDIDEIDPIIVNEIFVCFFSIYFYSCPSAQLLQTSLKLTTDEGSYHPENSLSFSFFQGTTVLTPYQGC
jgi:hypothetical protein